MKVYTGDLNMDTAQSVYVLDKSKADTVPGQPGLDTLRIDLSLRPDRRAAQRARQRQLRRHRVVAAHPDQPDARQVDRPGRRHPGPAGLMGSLFIRSRRLWVRVTPTDHGSLVEVAGLDRTGGADTDDVVSKLVARLQPSPDDRPEDT